MKIGLSQRIFLHKKQSYDSLEHGWYWYLKQHTIIPIANRTDNNFAYIADLLDAFIITGGDDNCLRRIVELRLANQMLLRGKPIIGICHGAFLLTEILGGTVAEIQGHVDCTHEVNYLGTIKEVCSYHSLSISQAQSSAKILAHDNDGNCEAWIDNNLAGIVWHPERMKTPWIPEEIEQLLAK